MTNIQKYNNAFKETFAVDDDVLNDQFGKDTIGNWDSVRQLSLVTALEEAFDIMFDTEDILGCISYKKGKEILLRYDIIL